MSAAAERGLRTGSLVTPKVFSLVKEQYRIYVGDEIDFTPINEANEKFLFGIKRRYPDSSYSRDEVNVIGTKEDKEQSLLSMEARIPILIIQVMR